jgi:hypothetical protein
MQHARRVARAGRAAVRRQHPSSLRARRGRSLPRCGELTFGTPARHRAPDQEPGRILIPGDGATGDQGGSGYACLPGHGGYATPAACPVSTISWRYGLRRTCRLVTGGPHRPRSAWPDQARLALPAVTHRYTRTHCLWLEQFHIADYLLMMQGQVAMDDRNRMSVSARRRRFAGRDRLCGPGQPRVEAGCRSPLPLAA